MIQKKKFSDAIAANISVVGELLPVANQNQNGLLPKKHFIFSCSSSNNVAKLSFEHSGIFYFIMRGVVSIWGYHVLDIICSKRSNESKMYAITDLKNSTIIKYRMSDSLFEIYIENNGIEAMMFPNSGTFIGYENIGKTDVPSDAIDVTRVYLVP